MKAPELALSPKASRRVPGVNVPVAAPNCALEPTNAASARRERPWAAGNMLARGCSAAGSSATAGAGPAALEDAVLVLAPSLVAGLEAVEEGVAEEDPHPAMTRATTGVRRRAEEILMAQMMTAPKG